MQGHPVRSKDEAREEGLYFDYTQRLVATLGSIGVLATLTLVTLFDPGVAALITARAGLAFILFGLPTLGGISAGLALILSSGPGLLRFANNRGPSAKVLRATDMTWWLCGTVSLGVYVMLLVIPPETLRDGQVYVLMSLLTSYWMAASGVSVALSPLYGRLVFFALVLSLLLTMPYRFGYEVSADYFVVVLYKLCFNLPILVAVSWLLSRSRELDESRMERASVEAELVAQRTAVTARRRTNEFVHDHVLSVLTAFGMYPKNTVELQRAARRATEVLRGQLAGEPIENVADLADVVGRQHPSVDIVLTRGSGGFPIAPASVAIYAAVMEAIGNAVRHGSGCSGVTPNIRVSLDVAADVLHVKIVDDGCGFEAAVANRSGRFGIDHGIHARMEEASGRATVMSELGVGTVVTLIWPALRTENEVAVSAKSRSRWRTGFGEVLSTFGTKAMVGTIGATYLAVISLMAPTYRSVVPSLAVLATYLAVTFALLLRTWPEGKMPKRAAWTIAVTAGLGNYVVLASSSDFDLVKEAAWTLGAGTLMACGLLMQRRLGVAWATVGFLFVTTSAWAWVYGRPFALAILMAAGQFTALTFWTVMVAWSTSAVYELTLSDRVRMQIAGERLMNEGVRAAVSKSLRSVSQRAAPLIEPIAAGEPLSEHIRTEARILEAELRDDIRAASFSNTPVAQAAREARRRGVEVVLLDDSVDGSIPLEVPNLFIEQAVRVLGSSQSGRVVVRLQPTGSQDIGTIVSAQERVDVVS